MNKPDVSVVMTVYNSAPYLRESVCSILTQSLQDLELIVVDDGSTDNTRAILKHMQKRDKRLFVYSQENQGQAHASNRALERTRGNRIALMDADDIACSRRLEREYNYLQSNPHIKAVGTWMRIFPPKRLHFLPIRYKNPQHPEILRVHTLFEPPMFHPTVMLDRGVFEHMQGDFYKENLPESEDYDLLTRLQKDYDFANLPFVGLKYRVHYQNRNSEDLGLKCESARRSRSRALGNLGMSLDRDRFETLCSLPLYMNKLLAPDRGQLCRFESLFRELLLQAENRDLCSSQLAYLKSRLSWVWFRLCCFAPNNEAVADIYQDSRFRFPGMNPMFFRVLSRFFPGL